MEALELIKKAFDANAFNTGQTEAGYVNPEYWEKRVREHVRANLVVLPFGDDRSAMMGDGDTYNFTIESEPAAAAAVAESAAVSISKYVVTQVVVSPTEYGKAYSITDKEARRAFFDVAERMAAAIGYSLALKADALALGVLEAGAGNAVVADGVASSALASTNTLGYDDVVNAMTANGADKFMEPVCLIIHPFQMGSLMKDSTFKTADVFGRPANEKGYIGTLLGGIPVYQTTQITITSDVAKAILLSSREAFIYGFKERGTIRREYKPLDRITNIVGVIDFDVKIARANAVCTIETWCA